MQRILQHFVDLIYMIYVLNSRSI